MTEQMGMDLGGSAPEREAMVAVGTVAKAVVNPGDGLLDWAHAQGRSGKSLHAAGQPNLDRGNVAHAALEALFRGKPMDVQSAAPGHRPFLDGLDDWYVTTNPKLLAMECSLSDAKLRVRGRIDYVRACPGCAHCEDPYDERMHEGGVILGDQKTGGLRAKRESHIQVGGGYRLLWKLTPLGARPVRRVVCGAEIVQIDQRGDYEVVEAKCTPDMFLRGLAWFRDLSTIPDPFARS